MYRSWLLSCVLVFTASGCFWPFNVRKTADLSVAADITSVEILSPTLKTGDGKVYFEPFSPGKDVPAERALDHAALMMVSGFMEASSGGRLTLVSGNDRQDADILIKGRVERFERRGYFKKTALIRVRGDVCAADNGEVLAVVYAERRFADKKKGLDLAAYDIGYRLARKILE